MRLPAQVAAWRLPGIHIVSVSLQQNCLKHPIAWTGHHSPLFAHLGRLQASQQRTGVKDNDKNQHHQSFHWNLYPYLNFGNFVFIVVDLLVLLLHVVLELLDLALRPLLAPDFTIHFICPRLQVLGDHADLCLQAAIFLP